MTEDLMVETKRLHNVLDFPGRDVTLSRGTYHEQLEFKETNLRSKVGETAMAHRLSLP